MRASKKFTPPVENRSLEEPVYVDEVYPEDTPQEDLWTRKPASPEPVTSESSLSFKEEDEDEGDEELEEEEQEEVAPPPAPTVPSRPAENRPVPPRSYRVKISQPRDNHPTPRPPAQKALPTELPRPLRRENSSIPSFPRREREERTGTWPVEHDPKRSASQPKNNAPIPPHRTSLPKESTPPQARPTPKEMPPVQRTVPPTRPPSPRTFMPPLPDIPPFPEPEPEPVAKFTPPPPPAPRPQETPPPPLFPEKPVPTLTPTQVLPPQEIPSPEAPRFQPLVDEHPEVPVEDSEEWELDETPQSHSVHDLIERLALPKNSLILGVCEDGLPLVLELSDPSPGALLFLGEEVGGMQKHLQAVLSSICLMSDPKQVQVDIITPTPKAFAAQKMYPHVQKAHLPDQDEMYELLGNLFGLVEQRQRKDNSLAGKWLKDFLPINKGPVRVLVIDQVDVLVEQLAPESLAYLRWLLRRGPAANVWVLASLNTRNAQCIDGKTLKAFGLRISGKIQNPGDSRLTDVPVEKLSTLVSGEQACLKLDEEIVEFSILE